MSEIYNDNGQDIIFDEFTRITYDIIGDSNKLVVKLGKPQKDPVWKYYCPYQIIAPDETIKHRSPGVDELKSIQNAIRMINIELKSVSRTKCYTVKRLGHVENDLGFFEWDIFDLKKMEASLKYDDRISSEERKRLEKKHRS